MIHSYDDNDNDNHPFVNLTLSWASHVVILGNWFTFVSM